MVQRSEGLRFSLESRDAFWIGSEQLWQDLDRDVAIELRVTCAVDLAHAAGPQGGEDLVRAEARAGLEGRQLR